MTFRPSTVRPAPLHRTLARPHHLHVSRRLPDRLYAGASGTIRRTAIAQLGPRYVVQPKHDGCYSIITTDATGLINAIVMRSGELAPTDIRRDFSGVRWAPNSALVCELEAWTESANRLATARGYRIATILDALRVTGRDVSSAPYSARRDALFRAESLLVQDSDDRPWTPDAAGNAHDVTTGHYKRPVPLSWRRMPIVEQRPASAADTLWTDHVDRSGGEGIVVVALDAPIGRTRSKRKCRHSRTLDAVVVRCDPVRAMLSWAGGQFLASARSRAARGIAPGSIVEVKHDGFTERNGEPKHPRIVRLRPDLASRL